MGVVIYGRNILIESGQRKKVRDIFEKVDGILCEIRDDVTKEKLQNVITELKNYFIEHLPQYEIMKVRRKSFHPDDTHLYMVAAEKKKEEFWAVWTGWNANTGSLNYGHYNLSSMEECDRIMDEFYHGEE